MHYASENAETVESCSRKPEGLLRAEAPLACDAQEAFFRRIGLAISVLACVELAYKYSIAALPSLLGEGLLPVMCHEQERHSQQADMLVVVHSGDLQGHCPECDSPYP